MSSLCFAIVYVFMFAHGFHANHDKRPTQLQRAQWMRVTDFGMVVVTSMMLVRDIHVWDWSAVFDPAVASVMPDVALLQALYRQSSPKDAIVALAMSAYVVTKLGAHKRLKADQPTRSHKVHRIQHFEFSEDHLRPISDALPSNVQWLDIGSGHGTQLNELLETMFETEIKRLAAATAAAKGQSSPPLAITTPFPRSVMLLDRDKDALDRAVTPAWWPEVSRREQRRLGMRSPEAVQVLQTCRVAHMSHVAYEPNVVRSAVHC